MSDSYENVPMRIEWVQSFDRSYLEKQLDFYRTWADIMCDAVKASEPQLYELGLGPFHSVIDSAQAYRERRGDYA